MNFSGNRSAIAISNAGLGLATANGTNCIACDRPVSGPAVGGVGTPEDNRVGLAASYARHAGQMPYAPGHLKPMTKDIPLSETAQIDIKKHLCTAPADDILQVVRPISAGVRKGPLQVYQELCLNGLDYLKVIK